MRYIALLDRDRPIENPLLIVRVDGDREEMFVPAFFRGRWEPCDPLWRTWFVNVAITEEHATRLLRVVKPAGPLEDRDPKSQDCRFAAQEGYYIEWFYYAIETPEHPFDDPLTVIKQDWLHDEDQTFTTDLVWQYASPAGRRIRITKEDADAFEEIQSRRVFDNARLRFFAITNPFDQDPDDPPVIARERIDDEGTVHQERHDGTWVRSGAINGIRHNRKDGKLTRLTDETAARLIAQWRPRPDRSGYYACLNEAAPSPDKPAMVLRLEDDGGVGASRYNSNGNWVVMNLWTTLEKYELVAIDDAARERLVEYIDNRDAFPRPDDVKYHYWAIVRNEATDDVMEARDLLRSWGGDDGTKFEEELHPSVNRWRRTIMLYEINFGHRSDDAVEITEEVAERLRAKLVGQVGFEPTT